MKSAILCGVFVAGVFYSFHNADAADIIQDQINGTVTLESLAAHRSYPGNGVWMIGESIDPIEDATVSGARVWLGRNGNTHPDATLRAYLWEVTSLSGCGGVQIVAGADLTSALSALPFGNVAPVDFVLPSFVPDFPVTTFDAGKFYKLELVLDAEEKYPGAQLLVGAHNANVYAGNFVNHDSGSFCTSDPSRELAFHIVTAPPPPPPAISNANQYSSDGAGVIPEGGETPESGTVFKATLTTVTGIKSKLQIELRQTSELSTGIFDGGILESEFAASGNEVVILRFGLVNAPYHWRTRAVDLQGRASEWQEFGVAGNMDFTVNAPPFGPGDVVQDRLDGALTLESVAKYHFFPFFGSWMWMVGETIQSSQSVSMRSGRVWLGRNANTDFSAKVHVFMHEVTTVGGCGLIQNIAGAELTSFIPSLPLNTVVPLDFNLNSHIPGTPDISLDPNKFYKFEIVLDIENSHPDAQILVGRQSSDVFSGFFTNHDSGSFCTSSSQPDIAFRLLTTPLPSPTMANLQQRKVDGITEIHEGGLVSENTVSFSALLSNPTHRSVKLQVELRRMGEPLTGDFDGGILESDFVADGSHVMVTRSGLVPGEYHWRARAVGIQGNTSEWQEFGVVGNTDFVFRHVPVIIVPGILGSRLVRASDHSDELWPKVIKLALPGPDTYLNDLALNSLGEELSENDMDAVDIIREELVFKFYGALIDILVQDGYIENQDLFVFPYDWRLNLRDQANRLAESVEDIRVNSPEGKVNMFAHSLGGVLVKQYLSQLADASFVDKVILAGVPQLGAPKAFKALNYGDDMGLGFLGFGLNQDMAKHMIQNMPSGYQLLPSRRYFEVSGGYVLDFRNGAPILDYDATQQLMAEEGRNRFLLEQADDFHQALDATAVNAPHVFNFMGCGKETIGNIRIYDDKVDMTPVNGDGTVPLLSANYRTSTAKNYYASNIEHAELVLKDNALRGIANILRGEPDRIFEEFPDVFSSSTRKCFASFSRRERIRLMFSTHSPVDLHIFDSQGNHTGVNDNNDIELEIPGSSLERFGGSTFIFVPAGQEYRIEIRAFSRGEFDFKIRELNQSTVMETMTYLGVPLPENNTVAGLRFLNSQQADLGLRFDAEGDDVIDAIIQPTALLSEFESGDATPPNIEVSSMPEEVVVSSSLTIRYSATDDISGVASVVATLDGNPITNGVTIAMADVGPHILRIKAVDRVGNPRIREIHFNAVYRFEGFLSPLKKADDASEKYKLEKHKRGKALPVKFRLTDADNNAVTDAAGRLFIAKASDNAVGNEQAATSTSKLEFENMFRYDTRGRYYVFHLFTDIMSVGKWRLRVELDDGKSYSINILIKK